MKKLRIVLALFIFIFSFSYLGHFLYQRFIYQPYLSVVGFVRMADGIGRQSVELIDAVKDDFDLNFISTGENVIKDIPPSVLRIITQPAGKMGHVVMYEDVIWHPYNTDGHKVIATPKQDDQIRIAYSMFESSLIPDEWVKIFNTYFDAIAVPDPFLIDVYKNSGVNLPIFVIPLGLNLEPFLSQPLKEKKEGPFVFGNLSAANDRKNQVALVKAFAKAFGDDPNVVLRLNARYSDIEVSQEIKAEIARLNLSNVLFTEEAMDSETYLETFKDIDCYISISKGEGFSIQPREAMALGIPAIVTDNTGQSTICSSNLVERVPSDIEQPAFYGIFNAYHGCNYIAEIDDVVASMKKVYANYDDYLNRGQQAREWVKQYQYENLKPLYKTLFKPSHVVIGNHNEIVGDLLITDSAELAKKYETISGLS